MCQFFIFHLSSTQCHRKEVLFFYFTKKRESNPATHHAEENKPRDISRLEFCRSLPAFVWVLRCGKETRSSATAGGKSRDAACCCVHFILLTWSSSHALIVDMIWKVLYSSVLRWWWVRAEVWYRVLKPFAHPPASAGKSSARALLLTELMWSDGTLAPLEDLYFSVFQWLSSLFKFILCLATWAYLFFFSEFLANCVLSRGSNASPADWTSSLTLWEHRVREGIFHVILLKLAIGNSAKRKQFSSSFTFFFSSPFYPCRFPSLLSSFLASSDLMLL